MSWLGFWDAILNLAIFSALCGGGIGLGVHLGSNQTDWKQFLWFPLGLVGAIVALIIIVTRHLKRFTLECKFSKDPLTRIQCL